MWCLQENNGMCTRCPDTNWLYQSDFIVGIQQSAVVYEVISFVSMVTPRSFIYVSSPNLFFAVVKFVNNLTSLTGLISVGASKKSSFQCLLGSLTLHAVGLKFSVIFRHLQDVSSTVWFMSSLFHIFRHPL